MRAGEIFALNESDFDADAEVIRINFQIDKNGVRRETKNRKGRNANVFPEGCPALLTWFELNPEIKFALRRQKHSHLFRQACVLAFPKKPAKWCVFHDLRHSYAIRLIRNKVPLDWVARAIGDNPQVAHEYYIGFVNTDEVTLAVKRLIKPTP